MDQENDKHVLTDCYLNFREKAIITATNCLDSISYQVLTQVAFLAQLGINWSLDNFGPIQIPAKGCQ